MSAVMCCDWVLSTEQVLCVESTAETWVSFVVERNFLPWKVLNETLVKSYQDPISTTCCSPHMVTSMTPV